MWRVDWLEVALSELKALWMRADSTTQPLIFDATKIIATLLRDNPAQQGESRDLDERVHFVSPLGVTFCAYVRLREVTVYHVWQFRERA